MKNFKKLSREELKNTFGGKRACKLVIANANGTFTTLDGNCDSYVVAAGVFGDMMPVAKSVSFCNTGDGVAYPLSSNGGSSNC